MQVLELEADTICCNAPWLGQLEGGLRPYRIQMSEEPKGGHRLLRGRVTLNGEDLHQRLSASNSAVKLPATEGRPFRRRSHMPAHRHFDGTESEA